MVRILTWNINSVRLRLPLLQQLTAQHHPDVICLQETKVQDHLFPHEALHAMGYPHSVCHGEKSYNGVAIISKIPLTQVKSQQFAEPQQCRHIQATLENGPLIHNFYIPAGGEEPDPNVNTKFSHKLAFLDALTQHFTDSTQKKMILLGDFNIAPLEHDVWSHKKLRNVISHTQIEIDKLNAWQASCQFIDSMRHFVDDNTKLYSWWSYRAKEWQKADRGRRLDHIWVTPDLQDHLVRSDVIKEVRGWQKPSDHAPVMLELDV